MSLEDAALINEQYSPAERLEWEQLGNDKVPIYAEQEMYDWCRRYVNLRASIEADFLSHERIGQLLNERHEPQGTPFDPTEAARQILFNRLFDAALGSLELAGSDFSVPPEGSLRRMRTSMLMSTAEAAEYMRVPEEVWISWESGTEQIPEKTMRLMRRLGSIRTEEAHGLLKTIYENPVEAVKMTLCGVWFENVEDAQLFDDEVVSIVDLRMVQAAFAEILARFQSQYRMCIFDRDKVALNPRLSRKEKVAALQEWIMSESKKERLDRSAKMRVQRGEYAGESSKLH